MNELQDIKKNNLLSERKSDDKFQQLNLKMEAYQKETSNDIDELSKELKTLKLNETKSEPTPSQTTSTEQNINEDIKQFSTADYKFLNSTQKVKITDKYWEKGKLFYVVVTQQGTPIRGVDPI